MGHDSLHQKTSLMLFGLLLTIVILEIGLRIGGFTILSLQEHRNSQSIKQKGLFRIMCLGESTTQNQYPSYLEKILNQHNIGIKFSVIDKGIGGTDTTIILAQLEANLDKYQPDMVVTMMGVNDEYDIHMPYEAPSSSKPILVLRSLKVYKLTRLLWLHMATRLKEKGLHPQDINKQKYSSKEAHEELQQEQSFKKAIELNPNNDFAYLDLGQLYINQGQLYRDMEKLTEAEQLLKKAIELNPYNQAAYIGLGQFYRDQGKFRDAEQSFKKVIELDPNNEVAYDELGRLYANHEKFTEAEQLLKKVIELNPNNARLYGSLSIVYCEMGNNKLSEIYAKKTDTIRYKYYNPRTSDNYHKLKQILDKRNIKLVCVQYPMRNITSLKKIFREETDGMIFVDNERIFKDALRKEGYKEYFKDMFGGDFGHCTDKGNNLLAGNIADAILKEVFGK